MEAMQTNWRLVVKTFIEDYMEYRKVVRAKEIDPIGGRRTPLQDLFFHAMHLNALGNVGIPLLNLHEAALGLAGLQLVCIC